MNITRTPVRKLNSQGERWVQLYAPSVQAHRMRVDSEEQAHNREREL